MKNQSVSDFVAAAMDAVLNSKEHKSLFATQYKKAGETMCAKHGKMDSCAADDQEARKKKDSDESSAWDMNDARKKKDSDDDSCMADDDNDARRKKKDSDEDESSADDQEDFDTSKDSAHSTAGRDRGEYDNHFADDDDNDARRKKDSDEDESSAEDGLEPAAAFDVAIDSLLTASAALDSVGLGRGSALTLKIASLVVEAKKKEKDSKKSKKDSKKSSKDSQSAKDKKSKDRSEEHTSEL